jgi:quercetin dioxygenase-like cupin family protein
MSTTPGKSSASRHEVNRVLISTEEFTMGTQGIVVQPGQGPVANYAPGRSIVLKLRCDETEGSIMMFEATAPVGTKSTLHLHHDSDEVAYVLSGEITFLIGDDVTVGGPGTSAFMPRGVRHAWKSTGAHAGCVLFLYTPAGAGGLIEEQQQTGSNFSSMTETERAEMLQRYGWELLGPSPL